MIDFIIMGAQKAGTVAAGHNLCAHPDIWINYREPHFFDLHYDKGLDWYYRWAEVEKAPVVGERTPKYIACYKSQKRIKKDLPDVKMIVLLRNPVYRAYSQWRMETRKKTHDFTFRRRWFSSMPNVMSVKGHYAKQLKHLLGLFSKEQVHVAIAEYVLKDMHGEYNKMVEFLGLQPYNPPCEKRHCELYPTKMSFDDWHYLQRYYQPLNEQLFDLLGYEIPEWSACPHINGM